MKRKKMNVGSPPDQIRKAAISYLQKDHPIVAEINHGLVGIRNDGTVDTIIFSEEHADEVPGSHIYLIAQKGAVVEKGYLGILEPYGRGLWEKRKGKPLLNANPGLVVSLMRRCRSVHQGQKVLITKDTSGGGYNSFSRVERGVSDEKAR